MNDRLAREVKEALDPYHSVVYFDPEPREEYVTIGLRGAWMAYFASRGAALGPVPAEVVIATFYGFQPGVVRRAIPAAWGFASPSDIVAARLRGADRALRRRLGDAIGSVELKQAALYAREAAEACNPAGRALFAAHSSLPWPDDPHLALWHAATLYREFRGDGHVSCLVAAGIGPCESVVLHSATGGPPPQAHQALRGWTGDEWQTATHALVERGWLQQDGTATAAGAAIRDDIERQTDALSVAPLRTLGRHHTERLLDLGRSLLTRLDA